MMKQKKASAAVIAIIAVIVLAAVVAGICWHNSQNPPNPEANNKTAVTGNLSNVVDANNQFALDLYDKYSLEEGNVFFSPYSISSALAMTYEGAEGQTAEEMKNVLHLPADTEKVRLGFAGINDELNKEDKSYNLTVANALWAQNDFPFKTDYFNIVDSYYGGKATNLDFKTDTENSRVIINNWVEDKTNDKIKDIIPTGALDAMTRLVLTNAIYFKANWSYQFDIEDTTDEQFKLSSGTDVDAKMMHQINHYNYGETDKLQILEMNYLGGDLSMLIILPKGNNLGKVEDALSKENIDNWKEDMKYEKVDVSLPRFKFETKYLMAGDLAEMGMPTAFDKDNADFTGMYNQSQTDENLYISQVIHQAFVNVTESGTEAAAATAVIMAGATAIQEPEEKPKVFNADHPFIFVIQQKDTGNILFMGRVSDPSK